MTDELDLRRTAIRVLGLALALGIVSGTILAIVTDVDVGAVAGIVVGLAAAIAGLAGWHWSRE